MTDAHNGPLGSHPTPGDVVGCYTLGPLLGVGAMASVYKATSDDGDLVAVKVLNPARVLAEDVKRFTREYKALARMQHPNVVRVFKAGLHEGYPWIAMELIDGRDLDSVLTDWARSRPDDLYERVERILRGMCRGLQYIHDRGLVHRDVKPSNVLIDTDGHPHITDFGVVKGDADSSHQTQLTMAGRLVGTVAFMAPELITGEGVDPRTDLYALGACLYMMLTGRRPIEADSVAGYLARHLTEVPGPPRELYPDIPLRLERITLRLLRKDKNHRYPSGLSVLQALDRQDGSEPLPLRGRDAEVATWTKRVAALRDGAGGVLALVGPDGSGRTHLLHTLVDQAQVSGVRAAWSSAAAGAGVLEQLARGLGLEVGADAASAVHDAAVGAPTVLAVDDADALSAPDRDALARLVRARVALEAERLLLVVAVQDADGATGVLLTGHATGLPADRIEVGPLTRRAVTGMLRDRRLSGAPAPVLGRRLHEDYGGWPGPILEQLDALIEHGWFRLDGEIYKPAHPVEVYRRNDLPVPTRVAEVLRERTEALSAEAGGVAALLATIDHAAPAALLARCMEDAHALPSALDELVRRGVVQRVSANGQERYAFDHPCMARVIRSDTPAARRKDLHALVAKALSARRRRSSSLEVAYHQEASGDPASAYPNYLQAARRAARSGRTSDVLDILGRAERVRPAAEEGLDERTAAGQRRWLRLLQGEALLDRRQYADAMDPLRSALAAARAEPGRTAVPRCLGALGRASYRLGRFDDALPLLEEAVSSSEAGSTERARASRALADIHLRAGNIPTAERLFGDALGVAQQTASRDGEARARRGLGHVRGIQGRLQEAGDLLAHAEELLAATSEHRVRSGVLLRLIELDVATGRFGSALYRAEHLVELIRRQALSDRLPRAYALLATTLLASGDAAEAYDAVCQARIYADASDGTVHGARLRMARVLADLGRWDEAMEVLPPADELRGDALHDPAAQRAAVSARCWVRHDPARATDQAMWALVREPPLFPVTAGWVCRDAAAALSDAGQGATARKAAKRGLKRLQDSGADGLRLELLVALNAAAPDPRIADAAAPLLGRVRKGLHGAQRASFDARPDLQFLQ